jgi:hypothetical protein
MLGTVFHNRKTNHLTLYNKAARLYTARPFFARIHTILALYIKMLYNDFICLHSHADVLEQGVKLYEQEYQEIDVICVAGLD